MYIQPKTDTELLIIALEKYQETKSFEYQESPIRSLVENLNYTLRLQAPKQ